MQVHIGFDLSNLAWLPLVEPAIRIEEHHEPDRYVIRAEIPGADPEHDVDVSVRDGKLHLVVVRLNDASGHDHTEFHYGTFHRTLALPPGARQDTIKASCANGILQITMAVAQRATAT